MINKQESKAVNEIPSFSLVKDLAQIKCTVSNLCKNSKWRLIKRKAHLGTSFDFRVRLEKQPHDW